jgi:hypothetical protein
MKQLSYFLLFSFFFLFTFSVSVHAQGVLLGDANNDRKVDGIDYIVWLQNYNPTATISGGASKGDFNSDSKVDGVDYITWLNNYGTSVTATPTAAASTSTPAPASPTGTAGIPDSMAMHAWMPGGKNAPNPQYDKCDDGTNVATAHMAYYVVAYDGKKYPTWHPPVVNNPVTGVGKCYFGHEHGTNPQNYIHWNEMVQHFGKDLNGDGTITAMTINTSTGQITPGDRAGIPFGIANEHMDLYYNQEGHDSVFVRHEDHVGHKIEIVNSESEMQGNSTHVMSQLSGTQGINVPYSTQTSSYSPTGVVCAHLHKFHQGTHSGDAILNNLHEVIFHSACMSVDVSGINAPAYYPNNTVILTGMMAFGRPGIYKQFCGRKRDDNICGLTGANFGTSISSTELAQCTLTDPLLSKLPSGINSNSLGRNMTDRECLLKVEEPGYGISEGSIYFTPYEIWEGDLRIQTASGDMLAEHGRQWDVLDPVRLIDIGYRHPTRTWQKDYRFNSEECDGLLTKPGTSIHRTNPGTCDNGNQPYDSPQAGFRGLKRTTYFGRNRVSNPGGSQIWWTDPLGGNAIAGGNSIPTNFPSGLKQKISPVEADIQRVQSRIQQVKNDSSLYLNDRALQRQFNDGGRTVHVPN